MKLEMTIRDRINVVICQIYGHHPIIDKVVESTDISVWNDVYMYVREQIGDNMRRSVDNRIRK